MDAAVLCPTTVPRPILSRRPCVLTEQEVSRSWRKLFTKPVFSDDLFERAEALIEEIRPESPLRHRLQRELDEFRSLAKSTA